MNYTKYIRALIIPGLLLTGCEQLLDPEDDNHSTFERVYIDPGYAEGLLIRAYTYIPSNDYNYDETATDDAATNVMATSTVSAESAYAGYRRIATGQWSAAYNPQSLWTNCNRAILYINQFLSIVDTVNWKPSNAEINDLFIRRLTGESYALRGLMKYFLLRTSAGYSASGQLLGIPIYNDFVDDQEGFATPRSTFEQSVASVLEDLNKALTYLPDDYGNVSALPEGFSNVEVDSYNYVFGETSQQRMSGRHVKAFKARMALLVASPAFNSANDKALWADAANQTAGLLSEIGGVAGLDPSGHLFYLKAQVDNADVTTGDKKDIKEILWRRPIYTARAREQSFFPPSLYGNARLCPSQNLVDAFPMKNGYPISDANSGFDPANPYSNRDPRFAQCIVYNGSKLKNTVINTNVEDVDDGLTALSTSTVTGYYLKKLLREDVNLNPNSVSNQKHFNTHIRYTELFLNYAEAANEAWGPDESPTGFTARQVIAAIRKRAGITQPDAYLQSVTGQDAMRTLIRNERRLELCFESFRFWDLRRWKANLTEAVRGVRIENGAISYFTVENRVYNNDYMHYGPLPYNEVIRYGLEQNAGW